MAAQKCEIDDKIRRMNVGIREFLHDFVPSDKVLPPLKVKDSFDVPVGGQEADMYEPLVRDLSKA